MIHITQKADCCGCNACGDVCSHHAISFKTDREGFWYPEVDMTACTDCGHCETVCPIINVEALKRNDLPQPECYAAEHKNLEVVFDSTSGGMFSALADIMYRSGGYVGGAIFNEDFSVRHYISNDKHDLAKLRSSKYLQSNLEGFFAQVQGLLKNGEKVLVCGAPCQMAALRAFIRKDYENLIIADYICRGINSPKVWRKYLDSFEERYGSKVIYCKAKSKEFGWRNLTQKVVLENGKAYYETQEQSNFTKGYLRTNVYCRPSCYDCKFKGYPRIADITLADFWGIERVDQSMEKDLGTSLVMVNSQKGQAFFDKAKQRINYKAVDFKEAEAGNPALNKPLGRPVVDREQFFDDLDKMSFLEIADKYIKPEPQNKLRAFLRKGYHLYQKVGRNPLSWLRLLRYNSLSDIRKGNIMIVSSNCVIDIHPSAHIEKHGISYVGSKIRFHRSKLETRLFVGKDARLVLGDGTVIGYGSDVEVFDKACLTFGGDGGSNIGLTIICSDRIEIGRHTMIGRNVTIRDNNGGHYLNRSGYRDARPVIIGEKTWLCEQCTIMSGVKIGDGAIVGACSLVTSHVPAHALVSGNPAQIVDEDILWKY
jgi:acetyltransferase-like isoleucine patch superfamily enzyme/coenzyme F420-reducing hydrogenase beta subunit